MQAARHACASVRAAAVTALAALSNEAYSGLSAAEAAAVWECLRSAARDPSSAASRAAAVKAVGCLLELQRARHTPGASSVLLS